MTTHLSAQHGKSDLLLTNLYTKKFIDVNMGVMVRHFSVNLITIKVIANITFSNN